MIPVETDGDILRVIHKAQLAFFSYTFCAILIYIFFIYIFILQCYKNY